MIRINTAHMTLRYGQDPGITARIILAWTLWILGEVDQVEPLALEALAHGEGVGTPIHSGVYLNVSFLDLFHHSAMRQRTLELTDEAIAVSTQYSFELGLSWATSFKAGRWPNRGERKVSASYYTGFPLFGRQVQVSTTRLRWRCLQKYIYGTTALTKAWAPLRTRRSLPSTGENCFGKRNCFD